MRSSKDEATPRRAPDGGSDAPATIREAGVRAALRDRRRRRADEAGIQSLVRNLATQMGSDRGG
jgi:hypothetical protein